MSLLKITVEKLPPSQSRIEFGNDETIPNSIFERKSVFRRRILCCCCCCWCCCCSVPQVNTLRVIQKVPAPTPVPCTSVSLQSIGWEDGGVRQFSTTPPCRQPHSVFRRIVISLSGEWGLLCQELTIAEDNLHKTRHHCFWLLLL